MKNPFNIIVLASGNGTNLGAILDAKREGKLKNIQVLGVISNHKASGALEKAREYQSQDCPGQEEICADRFVGAKGDTKELMETIDRICTPPLYFADFRLDKYPEKHKVDLICLIGYMRILTPEFTKKYEGKIINVHPSLLPKHGGKGMFGDRVHQAVLDAGETETGMTIHYVDAGVDTGKIILQKTVPVEPGDTVETLKEKVQAQEKIGYVEVLEELSSTT